MNQRKLQYMLMVSFSVVMLTAFSACGEKKETVQAESGEVQTLSEEIPQETTTVDGAILSLGDGSFVISQYIVEKDEQGGETMYEPTEPKEVTVKYTEDTVFTVFTSNDGVTSTQEAGTRENLEVGQNVTIQGNWDGEEFTAEKIDEYYFDF